MNILELIKARRTIQSFSSERIDDSVVCNAIEAAVWAPNHKMTLPWLFIDVTRETRQKLALEQVTIKEKKQKEKDANANLSQVEKEAMIQKFLEPSHLIIAAIKRAPTPAQLEEDYAAMACAIQNMSLYLWAEGVGTKWGTGALLNSPKTYDLLKVKSEDYKLCGLIWVGKARHVPPAKARPALQQIFIAR